MRTLTPAAALAAACVASAPASTRRRPHAICCAERDPTTPSGWGGFDIALLDKLADILGFTYDVEDMGSTNYSIPTRSSWTGVLIDSAKNSDLVMSFWTPGLERLNEPELRMLAGHIDLAAILISRRESANVHDTWHESFYSFLEPFSWEPSEGSHSSARTCHCVRALFSLDFSLWHVHCPVCGAGGICGWS